MEAMAGGDERTWRRPSRRRGRDARPTRVVTVVLAVALVAAACSIDLGGLTDQEADQPTPSPGDRAGDGVAAGDDGVADRSGGAAVRSIDCPFDADLVTEVVCGEVTMPGRGVDPDFTVDIAFARFSATGSPSPDPVVYLHGGPGASILQEAPFHYDSIVAPFIADRDVILYDQRGGGLSSPTINCALVEQTSLDALYEPIAYDDHVEEMAEALVGCAKLRFGSRAGSARVDPTAFGTAINAQDLVDLMGALGVGEYNLFGSSYGSHLAQAVMRDAPDGVRSVILTGVYPTDVSPFRHVPATMEIALDRVFAGCAADEACNRALPDPWATLEGLVAELDRDPTWVADAPGRGSFTPEVFTGDHLLSALHSLLYTREGAAMIPDVLIDSADGDRLRLRRLADSIFAVNASLMTGMLVLCADEHAFPAEPDDLVPSGRPYLDRWDTADGLLGAHAPIYCDELSELLDYDWPAGIQDDPVIWDVPTLVMAGAADPITPASWARQVADRLPRARLLVSPASTHDATDGWCESSLLTEFVDRPDRLIDLSCFDPTSRIEPNGRAARFEVESEPMTVELDLDGTDPFEILAPDWWPVWEATSHIRWRDLDLLDLTALVVQSPVDDTDMGHLLGLELFQRKWRPEGSELTPDGWTRSVLESPQMDLIRYVDDRSGVALVVLVEIGDPDGIEAAVLAPAARSFEVVS